uniref:Uncharacterized protein n=1 Tax=Pipistrellus kuhlii TaxID=59472 RepID=A0A7J7RZW8_PIPKU|nr:hypothetical protein mPipKuh1_010214 [Pipistrellus kuhlii]
MKNSRDLLHSFHSHQLLQPRPQSDYLSVPNGPVLAELRPIRLSALLPTSSSFHTEMGIWKREAQCHENRINGLRQQMEDSGSVDACTGKQRSPPQDCRPSHVVGEAGRTRPDALPAARSAAGSPCCPTHHPAEASPPPQPCSFICSPSASARPPCG